MTEKQVKCRCVRKSLHNACHTCNKRVKHDIERHSNTKRIRDLPESMCVVEGM